MDFFNDNWKEYVGRDEKMLAQTAIRPAVYWLHSFFAALAGTVFFAMIFGPAIAIALAKAHGPAFRNAMLAKTYPIWAALFALIWVLDAMRNRSFKYVVTSRGLYQIGGMVFKHAKFVAYGKITDTILKRGIFDLFFGTGTVGISTAGGTRAYNGNSQPYEVRFKSIPDYKKIQELVHKGLK